MAENNNNNSRMQMLRKVQEADFAAADLHLYLDTHPNCQTALNKYKEALECACRYRQEYETAYGPLTAAASSSAAPWQWIKNPWPWNM